jgi:predicted porin
LNSDGNNTVGNTFGYGANQSIFNRQANLYVQSKYGKATIGTQPNIAFSTVLMNDPRIGSNYGSGLAAIDGDGGLSTIDVGALTYAAPDIYGISLTASHVPEANVGTATVPIRSTGTRFSAVYKFKALTATYAHYYDVSGGATTKKGNIAGATYKFGPFNLKAIGASQSTTVFSSLNTLGLGGTYSINPETTLDFGIYNTTDTGTNYKADTIGLGVQYKFLKDLSAYAQYAVVKNNGTAAANYNFTWTEFATISAGQTASTLNVGLLYAFF